MDLHRAAEEDLAAVAEKAVTMAAVLVLADIAFVQNAAKKYRTGKA